MTTTILTEADVAKLVDDLVGAGTQVIAPVPVGPDWEETEYRSIQRLEEAALDGALPRRSLKEFFRPRPDEQRGALAPQVVLGARPCDAAGAEALEDVMGVEYHDELWRARRAATAIVSVACGRVESTCFCGAVGRGPDSTRGSDALLVPLELELGPSPSQQRVTEHLRRCVDLFLLDSQPFPGAAELQGYGVEPPSAPRHELRWAARAVTLKGAVLLRGRGAPLTEAADRERLEAFSRAARERVAKNLDELRLRRRSARLDRATEARLGLMAADGGELLDPPPDHEEPCVNVLPDWLARNQEHGVWSTLAPRCRSCGTCSAVCSTSPCFDVDARDAKRGRAVTGPFAPSPEPVSVPTRTDHLRQRVVHKFSIHPRRFHEVLCTGCGRCSRSCQGGVNLPALLGDLVQLAQPVPVRISR